MPIKAGFQFMTVIQCGIMFALVCAAMDVVRLDERIKKNHDAVEAFEL